MNTINKLMIGCATRALFAAPNDQGVDVIDDVAAYRDAFKATEGRDINLTDEVLSAVVLATDDDMEPEQWVELFKAAEAKADDVGITAMVGQASAIAMAKEIDGEFEAVIEACLDAERKKKMTAIDIAHEMERIYISRDTKGKVTKNELETAPIPGTDKDTCGNRRPDNYTTKDQNGKVINGSWWNDYADNSSKGKVACTAIVDLKKAKANSKDAPKAYAGMDEDQLDQLIASATADRNALRSMFKRGAGLHFQMELINQMENVRVRFIMQKDEVTLMRGPKPLWLHSTIDPSKGKVISVTQLLSLKPKKVGMAASRADLLATMGRDTDPAENGEGIKSIEDADETFADIAAFLNKRENNAMLLKELAKDVDDSGDLRISVCETFLALEPIYKKYRAWYEKTLLDGDDVKDTKAA